jgi:hypothetical protein
VTAARTVAEIIAALLDATPDPPADLDPETVLDRTTAILADAAPLIAELRAALGTGMVPAELVADTTLLHDRTQRWLKLADAARSETGDSVRAVVQVRAYASQR